MDGFVDASAILRSGVYALLWRGEVVYVGQSKCLLSRVYSHRSVARRSKDTPKWVPVKGVKFDEVYILPTDLADLDRVERELIAKFRPKYNVHHQPVKVQIGNFTATFERRI